MGRTCYRCLKTGRSNIKVELRSNKGWICPDCWTDVHTIRSDFMYVLDFFKRWDTTRIARMVRVQKEYDERVKTPYPYFPNELLEQHPIFPLRTDTFIATGKPNP